MNIWLKETTPDWFGPISALNLWIFYIITTARVGNFKQADDEKKTIVYMANAKRSRPSRLPIVCKYIICLNVFQTILSKPLFVHFWSVNIFSTQEIAKWAEMGTPLWGEFKQPL